MDEPRWAIVDSKLFDDVAKPAWSYWELTLRMLTVQNAKAAEVRRLIHRVRELLDSRAESNIVRITPAPRPGVYDGLEGADPEECRRQVRNLRNSSMRIAHRFGALRQAADALVAKLRAMVATHRPELELEALILQLDGVPLEGVTLSAEQAEALAHWASESERVGVAFDETGVVPGPRDYATLAPLRDAAMVVAREVRDAREVT